MTLKTGHGVSQHLRKVLFFVRDQRRHLVICRCSLRKKKRVNHAILIRFETGVILGRFVAFLFSSKPNDKKHFFLMYIDINSENRFTLAFRYHYLVIGKWKLKIWKSNSSLFHRVYWYDSLPTLCVLCTYWYCYVITSWLPRRVLKQNYDMITFSRTPRPPRTLVFTVPFNPISPPCHRSSLSSTTRRQFEPLRLPFYLIGLTSRYRI